jgi:hypothetical protein
VKLFAQFWHHSTGYIAGTIPPQYGPPAPIPATGDRSVIRLDARSQPAAYVDYLRTECRRRGYVGFSVIRGTTEARPLELI